MLCILLAVSLSLIYNRRSVPLGNDELAYQQTAVGISHKGLWPPLYPLLGSLVGFKLVSLLSLILLIVLLYQIRTDPTSIYLVALCPTIFAYGFNSMSEMLFTLLITAAIWLFVNAENWWQGLLSGLLAVAAYETRYVGIFLLPWMLMIAILEKSKCKLLGLGVAGAGVGLAIAANLWRYGLIAGERPPSRAGIIETAYSLGLAVWAVWLGDGPVFNNPTWILAVLGLIGLVCLLRIPRAYSLSVVCYITLLIITELRIDLDPIQRRYVLPIIPILIVFKAPQSRKWRTALVVISASLALAHAIRGRIV